MPISSIGSYLPTAQLFINHWTSVNVALGASPLLLKGAYTLALFTTDRTGLQTAITATEGTDNTRILAAANRDIKKSAIKMRLDQFRAAARYQLNGSAYPSALPKVPLLSINETTFLRPFDDMANLWGTINADGTIAGFTPPLILLSAYPLATFVTELASLRTQYIAVTNADEQAKLTRAKRNILLPTLKTRMIQYREAVLAKFGPADPFTLSLPAVTPAPGSTPDAVSLSGMWDVPAGKARLSWTPSDNAKLARYDIRYCSPPKYKADVEQAVASIPKIDLTALTSVGLASAGAEAWFKVYVITTDNNEKGSNAVKVTRP